MTRQQLQKLIQAGVFSAALLSGTAYAADMETPSSAPRSAKPVKTKRHKHKAMMEKKMSTHACAGQNGCKGQGGCKTGDAGCSGKNSCQGKGGCATDVPMKK